MIGPWLRFFSQISGGKPRPVSVWISERDWPCGILLLRCACRSLVVVPPGAERVSMLWRTTPWGTQWGQLDDRLYGTATSSRRWCGLRSGDRRSRLSPQPGAQLTSVPFGGLSRGVLVCWSLGAVHPPGVQDSYLVDSASSHMLVSKIKPCMSKYKQSYCETANGSLNQLSFI